ncbi:hypothetical protein MM239_14355 [Belliella sp. DSM 111904]|uniref:Lipoprotein n=1 Tax=Belliella filtrata TaxID=2923435 RepID=A0ABS9V2I1_9BACT|nr:hypothetical protein [Belliella filtrata]MCH7410586.1 hypothetical protein [Belliella filtrata]
MKTLKFQLILSALLLCFVVVVSCENRNDTDTYGRKIGKDNDTTSTGYNTERDNDRRTNNQLSDANRGNNSERMDSNAANRDAKLLPIRVFNAIRKDSVLINQEIVDSRRIEKDNDTKYEVHFKHDGKTTMVIFDEDGDYSGEYR